MNRNNPPTRLTVLKTFRKKTTKSFETFARCLCSCGKKKTIIYYSVKNGTTKSCGCLRLEMSLMKSRTHGFSNTPAWYAWVGMRARCRNKNMDPFKAYFHRGLTVCKRWGKFENFLEDMGSPGVGLTLERINNNLGYSPKNCRWATKKEQARNRRTSRFLIFHGEKRTVAEWAEHLCVRQGTILQRINEMGWSIDRALSTPIKKVRSKKS